MLKFDEEALRLKLQALSATKRSVFAIRTAKRLLASEYNTTTLSELLDALESNPESADQDEIAAFILAIQAVHVEDNIQSTLYVARRAYEHADELAQTELGDISEEQLLGNTRIQDELEAQQALLAELSNNAH